MHLRRRGVVVGVVVGAEEAALTEEALLVAALTLRVGLGVEVGVEVELGDEGARRQRDDGRHPHGRRSSDGCALLVVLVFESPWSMIVKRLKLFFAHLELHSSRNLYQTVVCGLCAQAPSLSTPLKTDDQPCNEHHIHPL